MYTRLWDILKTILEICLSHTICIMLYILEKIEFDHFAYINIVYPLILCSEVLLEEYREQLVWTLTTLKCPFNSNVCFFLLRKSAKNKLQNTEKWIGGGNKDRCFQAEWKAGWRSNLTENKKNKIPRLCFYLVWWTLPNHFLFLLFSVIRSSLNGSKCCPSFLFCTTGKILMAIMSCFPKCASRNFSIHFYLEAC